MGEFSLAKYNDGEILVGNGYEPWWITDEGRENGVLYEGPIPMDDIRARLFGFTVEQRDLYYLAGDGSLKLCESHAAQIASDDDSCLGVNGRDSYSHHDYQGWLVDNVETITDEYVGAASAGMLWERSVAWVTVMTPEVFEACDLAFKTFITATTSSNGRIATNYLRGRTLTVCDNTWDATMRGADSRYKVKHTKNSQARITDAREALQLLHTDAEDFAAEVEALVAIKVDDIQFGKVLDIIIPRPADEGRGQTVADNKRQTISAMYRHDDRVSPWAGTALGVVQAFNTYGQHNVGTRKGVSKQVRNQQAFLTGAIGKADGATLDAVLTVTGASLA